MKRTYEGWEVGEVAKGVLEVLPVYEDRATILALRGDLGAGKTTLTQSIAKHLGIEETVVSPTFVIAKFYNPSTGPFESLVHIDAYRIESLEELEPLGIQFLLRSPKSLIIIEWPERIDGALPHDRIELEIIHDGDKRIIQTYEAA